VTSVSSRIEFGQTKPVNFELVTDTPITCPSIVTLCLTSDSNQCTPFNVTFNCDKFAAGYSFTFIDYDGSVQYGTDELFSTIPNPRSIKSVFD
jgi:hypothetical protein